MLYICREIEKLRSDGKIIYEQKHLSYNPTQQLTDIELSIQPKTATTLSVIENTASTDINDTNNHILKASHQIWKQIYSNQSSIYLHVLLTKYSEDDLIEKDVITKNDILEGNSLHGTVKLIKYDRIPKNFKHRYLLADFGLVKITDIEGNYVMIIIYIVYLLY